MYLDYSKLSLDATGNPETPELILKTMDGRTIGVIPGAHNLQANIKFSEPSEMTFDVPALIDGSPNWIYDRLTGHKVIYTEHYGVYVTMNPEEESDGITTVKHMKAYSIEKELDTKKFFLEEGTFKFYDLLNHTNESTIIGRILEIAQGWNVGYISPNLAQRYRTFEQYDNYLLSFIYGDAAEKYRCVFVFDPYKKTISAYDADEEHTMLPIYLDFDNLIEEIGIEELSDELVTAIRPYGSDGLDIRDVNPIGTNWLYDLSHFVSNGDISQSLADKWKTWQKSILNQQQRYRGLAALRASATARLLAAQAALTDLQGELNNLITQQSVAIQAIAMETTDAGKASQQQVLDDLNAKIDAKNQEITAQQAVITSIETELDSSSSESYAAQIQSIVDTLSIKNFFTDEEYETLSHYFIEQDITEESFVATTVDASVSGTSYTLTDESVVLSDSAITQVDLTNEFGKRMYTLSGGTFSISGEFVLSGDIIRGTMEEMDSGQYVLSIYAGSIVSGENSATGGVITVSGTLADLTSDIQAVTENDVTTYEGASIQFSSTTGSLYLTANVSDYQKYSVQMELYDFAASVLDDLAIPTYEFDVSSGNFLFAKEFAPFRNQLELGKGVYLNIGNGEIITPYIIEFELNFEKQNEFSIVFSNRFKRHDSCNTLKDMIEKSYSSSRNFDASKYIYNQASNQASAVSKFMNSSLDAAKNTILAATNQSVEIGAAGISVGGQSKYQLRIVDNMIAMTDDGWQTAKLAIGRFASPEIGEYWGVNAEVIGGKLIVGNNLAIENEQVDENGVPTGVMQFKVDSSGAWLNNSTFVLQKDNGGKLILDPAYGIVVGTGDLFTTSGTTVTPAFIDENGETVLDDDGMPEGANFYLDLDGNSYFRGTINALAGKIGGFTIEEDYMYAGTEKGYVALNGSDTNLQSEYAFWAGAESPKDAAFWVKKNGQIKADSITLGVTTNSNTDGQTTAKITLVVGDEEHSGYINLDGNVNVSGQLSADALYASLGEVAKLSVDELSTSRRIVKYLAGDTSDDDYIHIYDQYIMFICGVTDGSYEQAVNPNGALLYWECDVSDAELDSLGYPWVDGVRVYTTTNVTDWPVYVYVYAEHTKRSIGFEFLDGFNTPVDSYGAGYGMEDSERGKGFVVKRKNSFDLWLRNSKGEERGIFIGDEYTDITGLRKTTGLNFSEWDAGAFYERIDGDDTRYQYTVEFDSDGKPVKITDDSGHMTEIYW